MGTTQTDRVLDYMRRFGSINPREAINDLGVMRLAARISDLRDRGIIIGSKTMTSRNRFGEKVHFKVYWEME